MQEIKFDVWSPVDNKRLLSCLFWLIGTLVSLVFLIVSLCVENAVLSVLDALLPSGIILYGIISRKKFPIYYYTTCLSGIYPICWYIFLSPDLNSEAVQNSTDHPVIAVSIIVFAAITLAVLLVNTANRKNLTAKKLLDFDRVVLVFALITVLTTQFFVVNVCFDKPYKTETVYVKDIHPAGKFSGTVDYTKSNSNKLHSIKFNDNIFVETEILKTWDTYDWISIDQNGNYIVQIEYGNGTMGMPWRRIVGNK